MRDKVIKRLEQLLHDYETLDSESLSFASPTTNEDIANCTDEQLIEILESFGQFEG